MSCATVRVSLCPAHEHCIFHGRGSPPTATAGELPSIVGSDVRYLLKHFVRCATHGIVYKRVRNRAELMFFHPRRLLELLSSGGRFYPYRSTGPMDTINIATLRVGDIVHENVSGLRGTYLAPGIPAPVWVLTIGCVLGEV